MKNYWDRPGNIKRGKFEVKAIEKLTDRILLIEVAKKGKYHDVRMAALGKITDQAVLTEIAKSAQYGDSRVAATKKLKDQIFAQTIYFDVAKNDEYNIIERMIALKKLNDQTTLANIAKKSKNSSILFYITNKLTDQKLTQKIYTYIAKKSKDDLLRLHAAKKLVDKALAQKIYVFLAINSRFIQIVEAAIKKISDQTILAKIAMKAKYIDSKIIAANKLKNRILARKMYSKIIQYIWYDIDLERLDDQDTLADIALTHKEYNVRMAAIAKLTDQIKLTEVLKKTNNDFLRVEAASRLINRNVLIDIARNEIENFSWDVYLVIVEKLTEQDVLAYIAINKFNSVVCEAALKKVTDQNLLAKIAKESKTDEIRLIAGGKLADQTLAQEVYMEFVRIGRAGRVRLEAAKKLTDQTLAQEIYIDVAMHGSWDNDRLEAAGMLVDRTLAQQVYE